MCEAKSNILFCRRKHQNHICHREALPCIHAFLGVPISPGICVDDLFRLIIISDDQAHMPTAALWKTFLREEAQLKTPAYRNTLVDVFLNLALKSRERALLHHHLTLNLRITLQEEETETQGFLLARNPRVRLLPLYRNTLRFRFFSELLIGINITHHFLLT